jgi:hypothetical protein
MLNDEQRQVADAAKRIYEEKLRAELEQSHLHQFVAIEPVSGEYFLGSTLSEAIGAARAKHPTRCTHAFRVGHQAAIHFGMQLR